jgi:NAD(P)H-dependent flavin oxidoreductase YrpB (nitropropane dioxygenase family)
LVAFDDLFGTGIGQKIIDRYFIAGGKAPDARFKSAPMQILHAQSGVPPATGVAGDPSHVPLQLDAETIELLIATGFAEVWLAKEGHSGNIFINFLNKIEVPLMFVMYGAMLAGVDGVVVGAGNPDGLAARCSHLANHQAVTKNLAMLYQEAGEAFTITFDPQQVAAGAFTKTPLKRPAFLAIVALEGLVQALAASASEAPDGFIIEHHTAGGHNANPVGPLHLDATGQPIYSRLDDPDLAAIRNVGLPFWMAGGYGSHAQLLAAQAAGATGVQTGSVFALAEESGMGPDFRSAIFKQLRQGTDDAALVHTTMFSPTGFSFKVVQLQHTLADQDVYASRRRICDIGLLQQAG